MKHSISTHGLSDAQKQILTDAVARRGASTLKFDGDIAVFESERWDSYGEFSNSIIMYMDGMTDVLAAIGR